MGEEISDGIKVALVMLLVLFLVGTVAYVGISADAEKLRNSPEGDCLTQIANNVCKQRGYSFVKLYSPFFDKDFACVDPRSGEEYAYNFFSSERRVCA